MVELGRIAKGLPDRGRARSKPGADADDRHDSCHDEAVGHLDETIIIPALVMLALSAIPTDVVAECRRQAKNGEDERSLNPP